MWTWMQRNLSMDDLWSALGYLLLMGLNAVQSARMDLPLASLVVSGMLAIMWLVNGTIRSRNRYPNARVGFWTLVAALSVIASQI